MFPRFKDVMAKSPRATPTRHPHSETDGSSDHRGRGHGADIGKVRDQRGPERAELFRRLRHFFASDGDGLFEINRAKGLTPGA